MRKLMETIENLAEGVKVNYDGWKTPVPKNLNSKHIDILQLMSDGKSRERASMIRSAGHDPNPINDAGFAGWNKLDYDLYKKGLLNVVDIKGGRKIFRINSAGLKALKLTEATQQINENIIPVKYKGKIIGNIWENRAAKPDSIDRWHGEHSKTGMSWSTDNYKDIVAMVVDHHEDTINEAYQSTKTEQTGAKKGQGAYYGRKKEAKRDSNKKRRGTGKDAAKEVEETVEIIGEGRTFVSSAAMVMWMLGALERMKLDYGYAGDGEEAFHEVMEDINNLIDEMKDAEIKTYPSRPTHGRRPGRRR